MENFRIIDETINETEAISWEKNKMATGKMGVSGQMFFGIVSYFEVQNHILEYFRVITGHPG